MSPAGGSGSISINRWRKLKFCGHDQRSDDTGARVWVRRIIDLQGAGDECVEKPAFCDAASFPLGHEFDGNGIDVEEWCLDEVFDGGCYVRVADTPGVFTTPHVEADVPAGAGDPRRS